jgi:FkbM family methyltransferase
MMTVLLKNLATSFIPLRYHLPLKFAWRNLTHQLEPEIFWLEKLVKNGERGIDVGANEGIYSYVLSHLCETVEAFEPQILSSLSLLSYSIFNKHKISVHPVALSDSQNLSILHIPILSKQVLYSRASLEEPFDKHCSVPVSVQRLDDYISFVKVDVEGHELSVVRGGRETIQRNQPILLIEIEKRWLKEGAMEIIFEEVINMGYEGFFLDKTEWISIQSFLYEKHQEPFLSEVIYSGKQSVLKGEKYINNFLFVPKGSEALKILRS